jgi:hypothetical protein
VRVGHDIGVGTGGIARVYVQMDLDTVGVGGGNGSSAGTTRAFKKIIQSERTVEISGGDLLIRRGG